MQRLFDADPVTRTRRDFRFDSTDDSFVISTRQDVTPVVELTQAEFNAAGEGWKGDLHKVASIPLSVMAELQRSGIWYDDAALRKWLDDRDNLKFRAKPGRLSR